METGRLEAFTEEADQKTVSGISRSYLPGPLLYLGSTLVAPWSPTTSLSLFAAIAAFYLLDSSLFGSGS